LSACSYSLQFLRAKTSTSTITNKVFQQTIPAFAGIFLIDLSIFQLGIYVCYSAQMLLCSLHCGRATAFK
jgi:hypothetical protein